MTDGIATPRSYGPMGLGVDETLPTYATIVAAFDEGGPLHTCGDTVSPELLSAGLSVSTLPCARLITEILHASPLQIKAGYTPALSPTVLQALATLSTPSLLRAQKSAIFSHVAAASPANFFDRGPTLTPGETQLSAQVADLAQVVAAMREEMREMKTVRRSEAGATAALMSTTTLPGEVFN